MNTNAGFDPKKKLDLSGTGYEDLHSGGFKAWRWAVNNKGKIKEFTNYWSSLNDYIISLYDLYNQTNNNTKKFQLANEINKIYSDFMNSDEYQAFTTKSGWMDEDNAIGFLGSYPKNRSKVKDIIKDVDTSKTSTNYFNSIFGTDWKSIYNKLDSENIDVSASYDSKKIKQYWNKLQNQILTLVNDTKNNANLSPVQKYNIYKACQELYNDFKNSRQGKQIGAKNKEFNSLFGTSNNPSDIVNNLLSDVPFETLVNEATSNNLANDIKNNISVTTGEDGNPTITGHIGFTYDDSILDLESLKKVINERVKEALTPFLESKEYTNAQKINALNDFFINNPNYTYTDLYNVIKFKDNLYKDINTITTSQLSDEEKINAMYNLANQYENYAKELNISGVFPFKLTTLWKDFDIDENLTNRGLLELAIDTTVDGEELSKALDMYLSNKSIYDEAIKNYEGMAKNYTAENLQKLGETYGDIESKYNAQKIDNQVTNTAKGLGLSDSIANQLGNETQYQKYAENLADNQMTQTDKITDYANNQLNNQYAAIQSAYNNASQAESALMSEADKKQAEINAYLAKKGVSLANDKYNYDRKANNVQIATNIGASAVNALNTLKNSGSNNNNNNNGNK